MKLYDRLDAIRDEVWVLRPSQEQGAWFVRNFEAAMKRAQLLEKACCGWEQDDDGIWQTECGNAFELNAGTPEDNHMEFCPYCGKVLIDLTSTPISSTTKRR